MRGPTGSGSRATTSAPSWGLLAFGALALLGGCDDLLVDESRALSIEATGAVEGFVFLDVDGSGTMGPLDPPVRGLGVRLVPQGGGGAVATAVTDSVGTFRMSPVPVGSFRLVLESATLPDSVQIFGQDTTAFIVQPDETIQRSFRLSFPTHSLAEVRALPPGQRVFTHGIVLNPRVPFGDAVVHLQEGSVYLRATGVQRADNLVAGDSVRVLGRTATEAGMPVLDDVRVFILTARAVLPAPVEVGSAEAASAREGALDAALVQIRNAAILHTVSASEGLLVTADDGSGPVEVLLRDFLPFNLAALTAQGARFERAAGLLVPVRSPEGEIRWRLTPRSPADLVVVPSE